MFIRNRATIPDIFWTNHWNIFITNLKSFTAICDCKTYWMTFHPTRMQLTSVICIFFFTLWWLYFALLLLHYCTFLHLFTIPVAFYILWVLSLYLVPVLVPPNDVVLFYVSLLPNALLLLKKFFFNKYYFQLKLISGKITLYLWMTININSIISESMLV